MRAAPVFLAFLRLGLTSFGGPVAHIGYFREEFVVRRAWLTERAYADLVALCQMIPGPASSQVGIAIGFGRAGLTGALAAWLAFTLPSAIALTLFALGLSAWGDAVPAGALHGLKAVAVAVVAQAVWSMGRQLCAGRERLTIAVATACATAIWPGTSVQLGAIALAAAVGTAAFRAPVENGHDPIPAPIGPGAAAVVLAVFAALLVALPALARASGSHALALFDAFYRSGALVFGGGHVVLPLLQAAVVAPGWVPNETFVAGYGAAQAVPGPLFTFAAFLGAANSGAPSGWAAAALCLAAIFLPGFLLTIGILPFWERLRRLAGVRAALAGVNAAVVGLLLAALYQPVWTSAVHSPRDFALALAAFLALAAWRLPPWLVVVAGAAVGAAVAG